MNDNDIEKPFKLNESFRLFRLKSNDESARQKPDIHTRKKTAEYCKKKKKIPLSRTSQNLTECIMMMSRQNHTKKNDYKKAFRTKKKRTV